jgi:Raf kinase inhibitor-like YbhB/YbcL family protein
MTDTSINLVHWVIWDIDGAGTGLPEGVPNVAEPPTPAGARQTTSYDNTTYGYRGPCPPSLHGYRFDVSALDVATLPGVSPTSSRAQVTAAIAAHAIDQATLAGQYGP